ncbi:hypothetical protein [Fusibacter sp. JL216-2]|uniref:hypothetical protein n=1 Tax=Fusibacter sp. JL216-2 TaxID=3071453 RepID=UPI003D341781
MLELLSGVGILGIIVVALFSGRWVTGFVGIVLTILAFGLMGGMLGATAVSVAFLIYMVKSSREEV